MPCSEEKMASIFLLIVWSFQIIAPAAGAHWFVMHEGGNEATCGTSRKNPCSDLWQTIRKAQDGDDILITTSPEMYQLCRKDSADIVERSVTITGLVSGEGKPQVGCDSMVEDQFILQFNSLDDRGALTFVDLTLTNGAILMGNGSLVLSFVTFENATVASLDNSCRGLSLNAEQTEWSNAGLCNQMNGHCAENKLKCASLGVRLIGCQLTASPFLIHSNTQLQVHIEGTNFDGLNTINTGLDVSTSGEGEVEVKKSTFSHFVSPSLSAYATNLFEGALKIRRFMAVDTFLVTLLENSFQDNERAVSLIGNITSTLIKACVFNRNAAMHSGAAILSLVDGDSLTRISDSIFSANQGGKIRTEFRIKESQDQVSIEGDTIRLNTAQARGSMEAIGRGGAIRLQRGKMQINDTQFDDNTANIQGGSIMSDIKSSLVLWKVSMQGPKSAYQPILGDILYSRGTTELHDVHFIAHHVKPGLSVMEHVGEHWSINVDRIRVVCPIGYNLRMQNISAFGITGHGLHSSPNKFDELAYLCEPCPYGQYSTDRGSVYNMLVPSASSYLSLALGSHDPVKPVYNGEYKFHKIKCVSCPSGNLTEEQKHMLMIQNSEAEVGDGETFPDSFLNLCPAVSLAVSRACQNIGIPPFFMIIIITVLNIN